MTKKPDKEALTETLKRISQQGIDHILKKLPPRYAEGVDPLVTAKPKPRIRRDST